MNPLASIIIPTHQHAAFVQDALSSALAQTLPCEVIVIDDGSTDGTKDALIARQDKDSFRFLSMAHAGVAAARNLGISEASGDYVMFLDADDTISPFKIARQFAALSAWPYVGWSLCDVSIRDDGMGKTETASQRYGYNEMRLDGWIGNLLVPRNFIPVMSPLIRRSVIGAIRFPEGKLEDWGFWRAIAAAAPCRYTPEVLATYNRRRTGRHIDDRHR